LRSADVCCCESARVLANESFRTGTFARILEAAKCLSAAGLDHQGEAVIYDFVGWPQGQFEFDRGAAVDGAPIECDFNALLLEGCRQLDDRRRGRAPEAQH